MKKYAAAFLAGVIGLALTGCQSNLVIDVNSRSVKTQYDLVLDKQELETVQAKHPGAEVTCATLPGLYSIKGDDIEVTDLQATEGLQCHYDAGSVGGAIPRAQWGDATKLIFDFDPGRIRAIDTSGDTRLSIKVGEKTTLVMKKDWDKMKVVAQPKGAYWVTYLRNLPYSEYFLVYDAVYTPEPTVEPEPTVQPDNDVSEDPFPVWVIVLLVVLIPTGLGVLMWKLWPKIKKATDPRFE